MFAYRIILHVIVLYVCPQKSKEESFSESRGKLADFPEAKCSQILIYRSVLMRALPALVSVMQYAVSSKINGVSLISV
jgi:hypothetical protein